MAKLYSIVAGAFVVVAGLSACTRHETHKIRLTATVRAGQARYSGSAVQKLTCAEGGGILGSMNGGWCRFEGEAVFLDIPGHGNLVLLMDTPDFGPSPYPGRIYQDRKSLFGAWKLKPKSMPWMVTFTDPTSPLSVKTVDPEHLDSTFGDGVTLEAVTANYTWDPVTRGNLKTYLPWVNQATDTLLDGGMDSWSNNPAERVHFHDLIGGKNSG